MATETGKPRSTLPCVITGTAYIPHRVLRKLEIPRAGVKPIQKQEKKIAELRKEMDEWKQIGEKEEAKRVEREIDARERMLNTINRHLSAQRGSGYKFRLGGTPWEKFHSGAWFEEAREIKEFAQDPDKPKAIPADKRILIKRFKERIEDLGLRYPEDTGSLRRGKSTGILESSEGIRIYPSLEIPVRAFKRCKEGEKVYQDEEGKWHNLCGHMTSIKRAFDPYIIGEEKRGRPPRKKMKKRSILDEGGTVTTAFADAAVVLRNAMTINQKLSKVPDEVVKAISKPAALKELTKLLTVVPAPIEGTVRVRDGKSVKRVTGKFYERRKRYSNQHIMWVHDEGEYSPIVESKFTPICTGKSPNSPTASPDDCKTAARKVENQSSGDHTCVFRDNKCALAWNRVMPAGVPSNLRRVRYLDTVKIPTGGKKSRTKDVGLIGQLKACQAQLKRV